MRAPRAPACRRPTSRRTCNPFARGEVQHIPGAEKPTISGRHLTLKAIGTATPAAPRLTGEPVPIKASKAVQITTSGERTVRPGAQPRSGRPGEPLAGSGTHECALPEPAGPRPAGSRQGRGWLVRPMALPLARRQGPRHRPQRPRRHAGPAVLVQGPQGARVLLPEGRHPGCTTQSCELSKSRTTSATPPSSASAPTSRRSRRSSTTSTTSASPALRHRARRRRGLRRLG